VIEQAVEPRGLDSVLAWDEGRPKNRLGLAA